MRKFLVSEVMSQPVRTISWGASVLDAAALMETYAIRRLPVVDDDDVMIGILSLGDVREATSVYSATSPYAPDHDEALLAVDEMMSAPVYSVRPDDTIDKVVRLMLEHKIGGVPVVNARGHAVGMITESDVFRLFLQAWEERISESDPG